MLEGQDTTTQAPPPACKFQLAPVGRTAAEAGSPEFAEDRTQINSLNNKFILAQEFAHFNTDLIRSRDHHGDVASRGLQSLTEAVNLQTKINQEYLAGVQATRQQMSEMFGLRFKWADMWGYNQAYDLANPVAVGTGAAVTSAAYTPNRSTDVAAAGVATANEAIAANIANIMSVQLTPIVGIMQQLVEGIAATNASIANVLAQVQPKSTGGA